MEVLHFSFTRDISTRGSTVKDKQGNILEAVVITSDYIQLNVINAWELIFPKASKKR